MARRAAAGPNPHPISLAELARRSGKQRSTITRQVRGSLRAARLADGRIDAAHDSVAAWARSHGIDPRALTAGDVIASAGNRPAPDEAPAKGAKRRPRPDRAPTAPEPPAEDGDAEPTDEELPELDAATIVRVANMTLGEVAEKYKTQTRFSGVLKNLKVAEEIRYKFLDNEEQEGRLISRDLVRGKVIALVDGLFRRLLRDMPKTAARRVYAMHEAKEDVEKAEAFVRELVSVQLKSAKERALKEVESAT